MNMKNYKVGQEYPFIVTNIKPIETAARVYFTLEDIGAFSDAELAMIRAGSLGQSSEGIDEFSIEIMECVEIVEADHPWKVALFVDKWGRLWATAPRAKVGWGSRLEVLPTIYLLEEGKLGGSVRKMSCFRAYLSMILGENLTMIDRAPTTLADARRVQRFEIFQKRIKGEFGLDTYATKRSYASNKWPQIWFVRPDGSLAATG